MGRTPRGSGLGLDSLSSPSSPSGPFPALGPAPALGSATAYAAASGAYPSDPAGPSYETYGSAEAYRDLGFRPLGAPPYGDDVAAGRGGRPYVAADPPMSASGRPAGMTGQG